MSECGCTQDLAIFWPPKHAVCSTKYPAFLESTDQFCTAFYHIFKCRELKIPAHACLREDPRECRHRNVTIVAQCISNPGVLYRYTNCMVKKDYPMHSEQFLIRDPTLLSALKDRDILSLYMQLQPCHHSGMYDTEAKDPRSCTTLLLDWYETYLKPRGIQVRIYCANIYKGLWYFKPAEVRVLPPHCQFAISSQNAREGIRKLFRAGIDVFAMDQDAWTLLWSLVPKDNPRPITPDQWNHRLCVDRKLAEFLVFIKNQCH